MKLRDRINLIPRNNWDFGIDALLNELRGAGKRGAQVSSIERILDEPPIWTNAGRTSLYAILRSLELSNGAKVGVPLFCCSVVFNAILQAGLTPRFIDSDPNDFNISVKDLRQKRSELAAVITVHMFGNPCDMDAIIAAAQPIPVIEDCAQSIFSTHHGTPTGLLSTASFFSFRCGKYISAGEGSAIFSRDLELRKKIQQIVDTFDSPSPASMLVDAFMTFFKATLYNRPWYGLFGYPIGTRLDKKLNLTAKDGFIAEKIASTHFNLINARLESFQTKTDIQRQHAHMLLEAVAPSNFDLPAESVDGGGNWFQFALKFRDSEQRDAMANHLFEHGIDTSKYLDTIVEEARSNYGYRGDCPNAELLSKTILLVPIHYSLQTRDIEHIARSINEGSKLI